MKHYRIFSKTVEQKVHVATTCDGCGVAEGASSMERLMPVVISIDEGEEGGRTDHLDYCDSCLGERAPALVTAGSRAPLVTGEELDDEG